MEGGRRRRSWSGGEEETMDASLSTKDGSRKEKESKSRCKANLPWTLFLLVFGFVTMLLNEKCSKQDTRERR